MVDAGRRLAGLSWIIDQVSDLPSLDKGLSRTLTVKTLARVLERVPAIASVGV